jgi:hypothetical protein
MLDSLRSNLNLLNEDPLTSMLACPTAHSITPVLPLSLPVARVLRLGHSSSYQAGTFLKRMSCMDLGILALCDTLASKITMGSLRHQP